MQWTIIFLGLPLFVESDDYKFVGGCKDGALCADGRFCGSKAPICANSAPCTFDQCQEKATSLNLDGFSYGGTDIVNNAYCISCTTSELAKMSNKTNWGIYHKFAPTATGTSTKKTQTTQGKTDPGINTSAAGNTASRLSLTFAFTIGLSITARLIVLAIANN